jgi:hypothetical protein
MSTGRKSGQDSPELRERDRGMGADDCSDPLGARRGLLHGSRVALRLSKLVSEFGREKQTPDALAVLAQLCGAPHRTERFTGCTTAPRTAAGLLEIRGDVLVLAGDERRAVPDAAVRLAAEQIRERLVHTPALGNARALAHRRAHERVAEAHGVFVELDDRRLHTELERLEPNRAVGREACGTHHLLQVVVNHASGQAVWVPNIVSQGLARRPKDRCGLCWL